MPFVTEVEVFVFVPTAEKQIVACNDISKINNVKMRNRFFAISAVQSE